MAQIVDEIYNEILRVVEPDLPSGFIAVVYDFRLYPDLHLKYEYYDHFPQLAAYSSAGRRHSFSVLLLEPQLNHEAFMLKISSDVRVHVYD